MNKSSFNNKWFLSNMLFVCGRVKVMSNSEMRIVKEITWPDIFRTFFLFGKLNIHILSFNLKAFIQNCRHLDFGLYFPNDPQTFFEITRALKKMRD